VPVGTLDGVEKSGIIKLRSKKVKVRIKERLSIRPAIDWRV